MLNEGRTFKIDKQSLNDQETLEVSNITPDNLKITDKEEYESFIDLYKGVVDMKCMQEYGTLEDKDLWEDCAKELFLKSKNYILLGYLLYCDSKVLYDKNNQLLIFINDTYNYNITYSYETNTFQINNNSDFTIKNDVSSYPIMFNEIQKIISLAEYQLEKDETINKNSIGARIRRIFKRY